jgi:hypothetical protein
VVVLADEEGLITDRASSGAGKRGEDRREGASVLTAHDAVVAAATACGSCCK